MKSRRALQVAAWYPALGLLACSERGVVAIGDLTPGRLPRSATDSYTLRVRVDTAPGSIDSVSAEVSGASCALAPVAGGPPNIFEGACRVSPCEPGFDLKYRVRFHTDRDPTVRDAVEPRGVLHKWIGDGKTSCAGQGRTFDVGTTEDAPDRVPGDRACEDALGRCSLRAAVEEANLSFGTPAPDWIRVPSGVYRLTLGPLEIRDDVTIEGIGLPRSVVLEGLGARTVLLLDHNRPRTSPPGGPADLPPDRRGIQLWNIVVRGGETGVNVRDQTQVTVFRSVIEANTRDGITCSGWLDLVESVVRSNGGATSGASGAGLSLRNCFARVERSTFHENTSAGDGGALALLGGGRLQVVNSTFSGNRAATGAFLQASSGTTLIRSSTITANASGAAGALVSAAGARVEIAHSVLVENAGGDCSGELVSLGSNLIGTGTACTWGGLPGLDRRITTALLQPLADASGFGPVHLPRAGSPAVDGSTFTEVNDANRFVLPRTDQLGNPRPVRLGDIGAVEAP